MNELSPSAGVRDAESLPDADPLNLYGLLAEFESLDELLLMTAATRDRGYQKFDAFCPWPSEELDELLDRGDSWVAIIMLLGGLAGGAAGYALQYWVNLYAYPLNVGGRPLHSWPAFIPPTFECTILISAFAGVMGMLLLNGLPRFHHPLFEVPRFAERGHCSFFLCLESADPLFDLVEDRKFLTTHRALEIWHVPKT